MPLPRPQQFFDVCNLLSMIKPPSDTHFLVFNGDLVDRGSWSVEVALTAFAYKWLWPDRVYINRGNHETNGEWSGLSAGWSGVSVVRLKMTRGSGRSARRRAVLMRFIQT